MTRLLLAGLCALALTPANAALFKPKEKKAAAPRIEDALRPLSSTEISQAVITVREAGVFASSAAFTLVALREPVKNETPGGRQVKLVVVDAQRKETSEAVVDLAEKKLTSWRLLVGVAPARAPFTPPPTAAEPAESKGDKDKAPAPLAEVAADGSQLRWDKWRLRAFAHPREGLVVSDVWFDGRSVLARGAASEIVRISQSGLTLVEGEEGFGRQARALEPRVDAPIDAVFLDAVFADDAGAPYTVRRAIAVFPRRTLAGGRELVARLTSASSGREYSQIWIFRQDGELQGRVEISGSTTAAESHFFSYRLDLDVDGSTASLSEVGLPSGGAKPLTAGVLPLRTALEARRDAAPQLSRRWVVSSSTGAGGYALIPGEGSQAPAVDAKRHAFLSKSLWALPYRVERQYAAGEYPSSNRADTLERWAREDEPLEGQDLVLWHTFGAVTLPAPGPRPASPVAAGFRLVPWGLVPKDPS